MTGKEKNFLLVATAITLLALSVWAGTGRDAYTKFEVVEEVEKPVDANDPFAGTGFYDSSTKKETVRRPEFRLGLLPTPAGLLDKHMLSVATLAGPVWGVTLLLLFLGRRERRKRSPARSGPQGHKSSYPGDNRRRSRASGS